MVFEFLNKMVNEGSGNFEPLAERSDVGALQVLWRLQSGE